MKRIVIFTEGQTELIFVREFLLRFVDASKMRLSCIALLKDEMSVVPYEHKCPNPDIEFLIINAGGDERVVSSIKERASNYIEKQGYEKVIGLRDLYCERYDKLAGGVINERVTSLIIDGNKSTLMAMEYGERIQLHFAIMEIEAWFLAMYKLFERINPILTIEYIHTELGIDFKSIDPQKEFFKPSREVKDIMWLIRREYEKTKDEVEAITSSMQVSDFEDAIENKRCRCFAEFRKSLEEIAVGCLYAQ